MTNKIIYLSRHGQSIYNLEERIGGNSDLSENGLKYSKEYQIILIINLINLIN